MPHRSDQGVSERSVSDEEQPSALAGPGDGVVHRKLKPRPKESAVTPTAKPDAARPADAKTRSAEVSLPEGVREKLDSGITDLAAGARTWSHLTLTQRARLLERLHATTAANAEEWADAAALSKGLEPGHP